MFICGLAVVRDCNNLILGQILLFVLSREVMVGLEDDEGRNSLPFSINALYDRCLLLIAWLDGLWLSSSF
jgi:hypothetical protein